MKGLFERAAKLCGDLDYVGGPLGFPVRHALVTIANTLGDQKTLGNTSGSLVPRGVTAWQSAHQVVSSIGRCIQRCKPSWETHSQRGKLSWETHQEIHHKGSPRKLCMSNDSKRGSSLGRNRFHPQPAERMSADGVCHMRRDAHGPPASCPTKAPPRAPAIPAPRRWGPPAAPTWAHPHGPL